MNTVSLAAGSIWQTGGVDNTNYNESTNWDTGTVPAGPGQSAVFNGAGSSTVQVNNSIAPDALTFNAGTYSVTGVSVSLGSGGLTVNSADGVSIGNNLSGSGSITVGGTLTLSGVNSYSGNTTVTLGAVLNLQNGSAISDLGTVSSNGSISVQSTERIGALAGSAGSVTLVGNLLTGGNSSSTSYSGVLQGAGGLTKEGAGTFTLSGANTYSGATTILNGTLVLSGGAALSDANAVTVGASAELRLSNSETIGSLAGVTGSNVVLNNNTLTTGDATDTAFYGALSGTGGLTKQGSGNFTLGAANLYSGTTTVNAGTLTIQNAGALGTTAGGTTIANGATLALDGGISVGAEALTLNGIGVLSAGALRSNGNNSFAGNITLASSSRINSDLSTLTLSGNISGAFNLTVGGAGDAAISGQIATGTGGLVKDGSGTLTLSGANTYTGSTSINAGTLTLSATGILTSNITNAGATFNNSGTVTGSLTNNAGATFTQTAGSISNGVSNAGTTNANGGALDGAIVNTGTFNVGGTVTSANTLDNNSGGTLIINAAGNYTISGLLTNRAGLSVAAGGTLLANGGISNAVGGTITNNGSLTDDLDNAGTVTNNQIYNAIVSANTGTITNSAAATWTGNIASNASVITNNGIWVGNVTSNTGALTNNQTWTGTISNSGTFLNNAGGTVSGLLTNTAGTATNNGALNGGAAISGGTFTGNGTVANTSILGGTFMPGDGTAGSSMTVNGTLGFAAAATYAIFVNPATSSSSTVSGAATLGNATVNATFANGSYISKQYTILTAGSRSGTFGTLTTSNLPTNFAAGLSYDATHAYLELTLNLPSNPTGSTAPAFGSGLSGNQTNVGNALINYFNANGGIPAVYGSLTANGLSQASGQPHASTSQSGIGGVGQFTNAIFDAAFEDSNEQGGAVGFDEDQAFAYAPKRKMAREATDVFAKTMSVKAVPAFSSRWNVWASVYGGNSRVNGDAGAGTNETTNRIFGTAVGATYHFTPHRQMGFALGGAGSSFDVGAGFGGGRADVFNVAAYAKQNFGAAYLAGLLGYSWQDTTTDRTVTIAGTDRLHAAFKAQALTARIEGGWRYGTLPIAVTPYAALQSTSFYLPGYGETVASGTAAFALSYASKAVTATRGELGAKFDKAMLVPSGVFILKAKTAWGHDWNRDRSATATFQSLPGATFTVNGATPSADAALVSFGGEMKWHRGWSLAGSFDGEFSRTTIGYGGKGSLRYAW